jgi:hypothetical protein
MANDKERDKLYQKAIADKWTLEEVKKQIPMPFS